MDLYLTSEIIAAAVKDPVEIAGGKVALGVGGGLGAAGAGIGIEVVPVAEMNFNVP